jgi:predicted DNA-binding helix-hairpin-helix protein
MGEAYYINEGFIITGKYRCLTITAILFLSVNNNVCYIHGYCIKLKMMKDERFTLSCAEVETLIQNFFYGNLTEGTTSET